MITYTGYSTAKRGSVGGLKSYYFTTANDHICYINKNKWLKFDQSNNHLMLSIDSGVTYPYDLDLDGVTDIITYSKIFASGNIMFATYDKIYYSDDNLATYQESTVLGIDGNPFVASPYDSYKGLTYHPEIILPNNKELVFWGNYSVTYEGTMNLWYTINDGATVKSAFSKGVSFNALNFRHFDGVNWNPEEQKIWMYMGDGDTCGQIRGTYNYLTDSWSSEIVVMNDTLSKFHISGITFKGGYGIYASDSSTAGNLGIWKAPVSNWDDEESHVKVQDMIITASCLYGNDRGTIIAAEQQAHKWHLSYDYGETWEIKTLTGGPPVGADIYAGWFFGLHSSLGCNFYKAEIQLGYPNQELPYRSTSGIVVIMEILDSYGDS